MSHRPGSGRRTSRRSSFLDYRLVGALVKWFRLLWAAPWSLVGALLGLTFERRRRHRGILLCERASWPRRLGWRYRAITFGHVVLCVDDIDEPTFIHELVHVRQYERWGPLFIPAYLVSSLAAALRGRHPYRDNTFELAARRDHS